jgi:serine/threonine-protein kinase
MVLRPRSEPGSPSTPGKSHVIGSRVASRYRVAALLHGDGVAQAYVAVDERPTSARRLVMLETLPVGQRASSAAIEAFAQGARLREGLNHPNVVQTYELVQHEGLPVLVTEYLEGESLATLLALAFGMPEFSLEVRLTILAQAMRGLAFIHQLGSRPGRHSPWVHANVSPHDIIVTYDGSVKLSGFGRGAGGARRGPDALTPAQLEYSAPERLHASLQPASDVFSAGILLWELVALQRFWSQLPEYEIRRRLVAFDIPHIARLKPQVGGELARICRQALAADPAHRYPSATPLAIDLERFLRERSALVAPATIAAVMKNACFALQREARQRLSGALDAVQGSEARRRPERSERPSEAGIWHVLTKERPMSGSTTAMWAAGALGAVLIAVAAQSAWTQPPSSSHAPPVALAPVSREAASREAVLREVVPPEAVPRDAVPPPDRAGDVPPLAAPERHSATTTIQTLLPEPERQPPSPANVAARARRARRLIASRSIPALDEPSSTERDEPALTIRLER